MSTHEDQFEVVSLTDTDWVVYARQEELLTGCGVLGFVSRVAGIYQVLELSRPAKPQFFSTLRSAVDTFAEEPTFAAR